MDQSLFQKELEMLNLLLVIHSYVLKSGQNSYGKMAEKGGAVTYIYIFIIYSHFS